MLVVEDDRFLRVVGIVLDPSTPKERVTAFADFFAHDERDFEGYCKRVRRAHPRSFRRRCAWSTPRSRCGCNSPAARR